jgi:hypothetical protein
VHPFLLKREKANTTLSESFPKSYRRIADQWPLHTKTGRHDIAEILLKVALDTKNQSRFIPTNSQVTL